MTGPFGQRATDPEHRARRDAWRAEKRQSLREVAEQKRVAFFDIAGAADRYIDEAAEAGWQRRDFHRDRVHANHYGKQLLGRLLLRRLGP